MVKLVGPLTPPRDDMVPQAKRFSSTSTSTRTGSTSTLLYLVNGKGTHQTDQGPVFTPWQHVEWKSRGEGWRAQLSSRHFKELRWCDVAPIIVVGAGSVGLVLALALDKHCGVKVELYEQATAFHDNVGAGMGMYPNGLRVVRDISPQLLKDIQGTGYPYLLQWYEVRNDAFFALNGKCDPAGYPTFEFGTHSNMLPRSPSFLLFLASRWYRSSNRWRNQVIGTRWQRRGHRRFATHWTSSLEASKDFVSSSSGCWYQDPFQ